MEIYRVNLIDVSGYANEWVDGNRMYLEAAAAAGTGSYRTDTVISLLHCKRITPQKWQVFQLDYVIALLRNTVRATDSLASKLQLIISSEIYSLIALSYIKNKHKLLICKTPQKFIIIEINFELLTRFTYFFFIATWSRFYIRLRVAIKLIMPYYLYISRIGNRLLFLIIFYSTFERDSGPKYMKKKIVCEKDTETERVWKRA